MPTLTELLTQKVPLEEDNADHQPLLKDLQCNILSSHGKPSTHYFFVRFEPDPASAARHLLKALAHGSWHGAPSGIRLDSELRSRAERLRKRSEWAAKALGPGSTPFSTNLLLTASGYRTLLPDCTLPPDAAFQQGMAGRDERRPPGARLHDRVDPQWVERMADLHALYLVGYDPSEVDWPEIHAGIRRFLGKSLLHEEAGYVLRHPTRGYPIEPFGYRDAISQPLFYRSDLEARRSFEGAAASVQGGKWSSFARLETVLVRDPNGAEHYACGSYFVYRKLTQNIARFYAQAEALAAKVPPCAGGGRLSRDDVADRLIGRHVDGRPLDPATDYNDFVYGSSTACPAHAHVRKVNPRDAYSLGRRIVRRAAVFGPKLQRDKDGRPKLDEKGNVLLALGETESRDGVGLLFTCCQADISAQYETVQGVWANRLNDGADTVIGQTPAGEQNRIGLNGSGLQHPYEPVVGLLGGEYFFAPSISFFSRL